MEINKFLKLLNEAEEIEGTDLNKISSEKLEKILNMV